MNYNLKVRLLQLFNFIASIVAVSYVFYTNEFYWLWVSLASWFVIGHISSIITLHRMLTHKSFKTWPWLEKILIWLTVYSTIGPTIAWVGLHRVHHVNSDKHGDPHSPHVDGKFNYWAAFKVWIGYDWHVEAISLKYVKDLIRSPLHKFIFNHYFKIIIITGLILIAIDPLLFLFLYALPATLTVQVIGLVNVLGHHHGYRNFETTDRSTNSWIAAILALGEGWHNNHHANPGRWYAGEKWWELDPMGWIIKLIKIN
jgi:stearoyl-CoA desaturase (delta-9 desaturase)